MPRPQGFARGPTPYSARPSTTRRGTPTDSSIGSPVPRPTRTTRAGRRPTSPMSTTTARSIGTDSILCQATARHLAQATMPARPTRAAQSRARCCLSPLTFPGMPHPRWWTIEDSQTNFGAIRPDTTDLAKLLLIEFGLVYSNDWFTVPFTLPRGRHRGCTRSSSPTSSAIDIGSLQQVQAPMPTGSAGVSSLSPLRSARPCHAPPISRGARHVPRNARAPPIRRCCSCRSCRRFRKAPRMKTFASSAMKWPTWSGRSRRSFPRPTAAAGQAMSRHAKRAPITKGSSMRRSATRRRSRCSKTQPRFVTIS